MRSSLLLLLVTFTSGAAWGDTGTAADSLHIAALDCEFRLPASYTIKVSNEPGVYIYSQTPFDRTNFSFGPLDASVTGGFPPPVSSQRKGPLVIEHYEAPMSGRHASEKILMTLIRGQSQQLTIGGMPQVEAEKYVAQCVATLNPAVVAVSQRRAQGCASELSFDTAMNTILGQARRQAVFSGEKFRGWRIYGIDASSELARADIPEGTLLSHVCGVPADELMASPDNICCATDTTREISVTFSPNRAPPMSIAIKRGLQACPSAECKD